MKLTRFLAILVIILGVVAVAVGGVFVGQGFSKNNLIMDRMEVEKVSLALDPDNPEVTVTQLEDGKKYYFVLAGFDKANNESNFSNEICAEVEGASIVDCASSSSLVSDSKNGGGGSSGGG